MKSRRGSRVAFWTLVFAELALGTAALVWWERISLEWYYWNHRKEIAACRETLEIFDAIELPSPRGRRLVIYNAGDWMQSRDETGAERFAFSYRLGWVLRESQETIVLAEDNFATTTYSRRVDMPESWERWRSQHPVDRPLPGETRPLDFEEHCRGVLTGGEPVTRALYAHWALERRKPRLALKLLELAKGAGRGRSLEELLRESVASNLRHQAITGANNGAPRRDLLERWKVLARVAPEDGAREAREMVSLYEDLLAEDARWREPEPEALAKASRSDRAAYWIYRLRDLAATQTSQPGSCQILEPFAGIYGGVYSNENPAEELVQLGWDAIPFLIAHLDDERPTRSMGFWRNFAPDSYYLLRYGDCCQRVFEAITGLDLHEKSARAAAESWWKEYGDKGAERFYLDSLEAKGRAAFAAAKLLEIDREKHLPRLIGLLEGDRGQRNAILPVVSPHLGKEHEPLLESFLDETSPETVLVAARALWKKCSSDAGAGKVAGLLKELSGEGDDFWLVDPAFSFLSGVGGEAAVAAVCDLMVSPNKRIRMQAIAAGANLPSRRVAGALVRQLEDTTSTGRRDDYELRFCDMAAKALVSMARLAGRIEYEGSEEERDEKIAQLKSWWTDNRDSMDWAALPTP